MSKAVVLDRNEPLTHEGLIDPHNPVVVVLNWCYTSSSFVYEVLNRTCRLKDDNKIANMGPYAAAFS